MSAWGLQGQVVGENGQVERATVVVDGGRIADVVLAPPASLAVEDVGDDIIAPGLIDLQLNGAFGHDFTLDPGSAATVAAGLPRYGVTAFLPTIITSPLETYPDRLRILARLAESLAPLSATILGVHVEGPFLSYGKRGAHNPAYLRTPSIEALKPLLAEGNVRLMTLAPELPGAAESIAFLHQNGVVVSLGHSEADYDTAHAALEAGAGWGTHLFNAMPTLGHREPGLVGALLEQDAPPVGLIVDGVHVHPSAVRVAWRAKGVRGISLVSDAMAALGMPPGVYHLGDDDVIVDEVSARRAHGTLAGSILSMDEALRKMVAYTGCAPGEAVWMATGVPGDILGLQHKGRLAPGYDADIVVLSPDLRVRRTIICGQTAYTCA
ncbi:MAG: N-acetylglucosamine-6-phosphate deacetylase [Anaerolineae bacterium]